MGFGLSAALFAGCSSGSADDESETGQASDAMRGRRHGRHGFDYRGPRPHPHARHRHFRCDHDGGDQLSCIDARALHGIRFKARGSGLVKLNAATRATTAVEFGGTCTGAACGFSPFYVIALGADWQTFDVPFAALSPGNLPFNPADMLGVHYQAFDFSFPATAPIAFDFCVDDIELY